MQFHCVFTALPTSIPLPRRTVRTKSSGSAIPWCTVICIKQISDGMELPLNDCIQKYDVSGDVAISFLVDAKKVWRNWAVPNSLRTVRRVAIAARAGLPVII
eukprot:TRINITY_DN17811_c0_g1_i2.p1 TRINITY_DN17811_c0_g1~~TRINITY_DN17811_c0_g1_i2.p1  ORF type:complete len:102 (-),score=0.70 TRINITY_DN17811_c0_g1_i2:49-354(-)